MSTVLPAALAAPAVALAGEAVTFLTPAVPVWPWWVLSATVVVWASLRWVRLRAAWSWSGYSLTETDLWVRAGLWTRHIESLSYGRIQTITVHSGPVQRRFRLATVSVATGSYYALAIAHVSTEQAEEIRDRLTAVARNGQVPL
ncbi:PH domain-containing protein [Kitasatospora sp. NPDC056783]|uniref:PH domain-containing protein n=1 Tax=Kitasatospora sp. NPDC056783 TaxID=3345943 RepID=UPI0036A34916